VTEGFNLKKKAAPNCNQGNAGPGEDSTERKETDPRLAAGETYEGAASRKEEATLGRGGFGGGKRIRRRTKGGEEISGTGGNSTIRVATLFLGTGYWGYSI